MTQLGSLQVSSPGRGHVQKTPVPPLTGTSANMALDELRGHPDVRIEEALATKVEGKLLVLFSTPYFFGDDGLGKSGTLL